MEINDELIRKFLADECTLAEAVFVSEYLDKNPAVLKEYLQQEWDEAKSKGKLDRKEYEGMLGVLKKEIFPRQSFFRQRHIKWMGVAASVLLIVGYWGFFRANKQKDRIAVNSESIHPALTVVNSEVTKYNTTNEPLLIGLPDHSAVTLSPGASLRYTDIFAGDKRDVYLQGEAFFEVAKDKTKPFTVYAGLFSTTALGTSFRVTEASNNCQVKLYTGKVVIKSRKEGIAGWNKDVYLLPGQQMHYDTEKGSVSVTEFSQQSVSSQSPALPAKASAKAGLEFKNTALSAVLDQLSQRYDHTIEYNKIEIDGMYFTGSVLKTDSLPVILEVIARMNGLTISSKADGFIIRKSP